MISEAHTLTGATCSWHLCSICKSPGRGRMDGREAAVRLLLQGTSEPLQSELAVLALAGLAEVIINASANEDGSR